MGKRIDAEGGQGTVRRYSFTVSAGQFVAVKVQQQAVDLVAALFDPDRRLIQVVDENSVRDTEVIGLVADRAGTYTIQVGPADLDAKRGGYSIALTRRERAGATPQAKAEQLLNSWYDARHPGAAVAVLKDDRVVFKAAKGLAYVEGNLPITTSTRFDLASVSKQFTAFAVAMLVDKGLVSLDDDVRKYIPETARIGRKITVQQLLDHTSGIRDWGSCFGLAGYKIEDGITNDMILAMVARQRELNFDPGTEFKYSNTGYTLLAELVKRVTGRPFSVWTRENIFLPLGMASTFFNDDYQIVAGDRALSYRPAGESSKLISGNGSAAYGSSSLNASLDDLVKWVRNFDTGTVGGHRVLELIGREAVLNTGQRVGYAFGNHISTYKNIDVIQHLGLAAGYRTSLIRYPKQRIAVIYLSNSGDDATYGRASRIAELYLSGVKTPPIEIPSTDSAAANAAPARAEPPSLADYVGIYYSDELNVAYDLKSIDGGLAATHPRNGIIPLTHAQSETFKAGQWFMRRLEFIRGNDKRVTGVRVSNDSDRNLLFTKLISAPTY